MDLGRGRGLWSNGDEGEIRTGSWPKLYNLCPLRRPGFVLFLWYEE